MLSITKISKTELLSDIRNSGKDIPISIPLFYCSLGAINKPPVQLGVGKTALAKEEPPVE